MSSTINLKQVIITDLMGAITLIVIAIANRWRLRANTQENRSLKSMIAVTFASCVTEAIVFVVDGKPGMLCRVLLGVGNTWLFLTNLILMPCWMEFVRGHLNVPRSGFYSFLVNGVSFVGLALLIVNIFTPVVFSIDANNVYHRESCYIFFAAAMPLMLIYSIGMYFYAKSKGGNLQFFPVWVFVIPVILGAGIQSFFYGVSTLWPFTAIGIGALVCCLQNEVIFRDHLTGIYNRFYLDILKNRLGANENAEFYFMMLDLNGFKSINDTYGHSAGDEALVTASSLLRKAVGSEGVVMRYAGDEFVIVLNTREQASADQCVEAIRETFREFNRSKETLYDLSASIGCCMIDLRKSSDDELMNIADKLMFEDKKRYYETLGNDRRKVTSDQ